MRKFIAWLPCRLFFWMGELTPRIGPAYCWLMGASFRIDKWAELGFWDKVNKLWDSETDPVMASEENSA